MKTIKEWLQELPEPYKTQALNNTSSIMANNKVESLSYAIESAFIWTDTPEGHFYWRRCSRQLKSEGK